MITSTTLAEQSETQMLSDLPSILDAGIARRCAIGLVVLATDQTMEHEFRHVMRLDGVALYQSRVFNDAMVTPETLRAMRERIAPATALILPGLPLDVVGFGCTAAAMELGEKVIFDEIGKVRPGIACTTPVTAALAAFRTLGLGRIGVITPYGPELNSSVARYLNGRGVRVAAIASFNREDDREAARISPASIAEGIAAMASRSDVDAIFVSCTSLRLTEVAEITEAASGKPVTSSNHALAWHCLRLAGIGDAMEGLGRLYRLGLQA